MNTGTPKLPRSKMPHVGTTIFTEMSALASACGALNVAQGFPDLATPESLRKAVAHAIEAGHNQYAPMAGNPALRHWIAGTYHAGAGYDADTEITIGAGASSVLFAAMAALVEPGDEVVVQDPCYDLYAPLVELHHGHVVRVPLTDDQGEMNAFGLANAIGPRTRLVVINSPHNPTGKVTTQAMLDALAQAMEGTHAWLVSDEVYGPMVHDSRPAPLPILHPGLRNRTLVAGSFGKLFHATGWKIGWIAAPAEVTTELRKIHQYDVFSTGAPFQAGLVSYLQTQEAMDHLATVGPIYAAKRDRLLHGLKGTAFTWTPAEGGYFQVLGVAAYLKPGENDGDLARRWTRDHGIATIPMNAFGGLGMPAVRICFAKEDDTIDQAVALLRAIPVEAKTAPAHAGPTHQPHHRHNELKSLRVLGLQEDLVWQDGEANLARFTLLMNQELAKAPVDLVVLPEMFTTGFSMSNEHLETLDEQGLSDTARWMLRLAAHHDVAVTGSVAVRDLQGATFNRMWFATPEGDLHHYDKRHLFTLAGEHRVYNPGTERVELTWRGWRILLQICYDLRFPAFVRNHGSAPYDLAIYVANWPEPRKDAWRTLLQARAIENQCHVVGINRCGVDGNGHTYSGDSLVADHTGSLLADAGSSGNTAALRATLSKEKLDAFRQKLPFLSDADRFGLR